MLKFTQILMLSLILAVPALSQQTTFIFDLDASQVVGTPSTSTARGKAFVTLDASNMVTMVIHHDVPGASLLSLETGTAGSAGNTYNIFSITTNPITVSFPLGSAADAATMMSDGFLVQIFQAGSASPAIRGQITNGFPGQVFISEYCNDPVPPGQSVGIDTNLDGIAATSSSQNDDEFVEIVNGTDQPVSLDNWTFSDAVQVRHTFPVGTTLQPGEAITLFGGGNIQTFTNFGLQAQVANGTSSSLGLNNSSDTLKLADNNGVIIDQISYVSGMTGDGDGESIVRIPETPLGALQQSTIQPFNPNHSAGRRASNTFPWSSAALPTAMYPGNGTDAAIEVSINGVIDAQPTNVHQIQGGDVVQLRYYSPGGSLSNHPFLAVAQPFTTGFPSPPTTLGNDPFPTVVYSALLPTFVLADGLSQPFLPFTPVLDLFVHSGYIPMSAAGTNTSYIILLIAFDPGRNSLDLGNAEAHELVVQ